MPIRFARSAFIGLIAAHLFAASPAFPSPPVLGEQKYFKDWAVGCDNKSNCRAVAMMRPNEGEDWLSVSVSRGIAADQRLTISVSPRNNVKGIFQLRVDQRSILTGDLRDEFDAAEIMGRDADKAIRVMTRGRELVLRIKANGVSASASLSGIAAALRYMDERQGRAGTKDALLAKGRKPYVPAFVASQPIMAKRTGDDAALPDTSDIVALAEQSICRDERDGITEDYVYSLGHRAGQTTTLILLNCGTGVYNRKIAAYIGTRSEKKNWQFAPASFDFNANPNEETTSLVMLLNVHWNREKQILSSFAKARGIGDCGAARDYVWDGAQFRLIRVETMDECRGAREWLPRWTASVVYTE